MKKTILVYLCLAMAALCSAAAQESQSPQTEHSTAQAKHNDETDIRLLREDIRAQRKKIVAANLPLTEAEATKFWPVYDRYVAEMRKINDDRYALIKEYAQNYQTMTDAQAGDLIRRSLSLDSRSNELRMKYVDEFKKVISPKKVAMFFQIDHRIDLLLNLKIASEIPLVMP